MSGVADWGFGRHKDLLLPPESTVSALKVHLKTRAPNPEVTKCADPLPTLNPEP